MNAFGNWEGDREGYSVEVMSAVLFRGTEINRHERGTEPGRCL